MTTTAFQYVFDNAESISINRRAVTAQTITRDSTVRTVSRGGQVWRFDVKLPDGPRWSTMRSHIEAIDFADRFTTGTIQLNNAGYSDWLANYQGDAADPTAITATWLNGATQITLTSGQATSGYTFRAGDIIQLGSTGRCYSVRADTAYDVNTVLLNRPIIDSTGSGTLKVAEDCTWTVVCTSLPTWTIFARDQVSWSGSFTFYESMI